MNAFTPEQVRVLTDLFQVSPAAAPVVVAKHLGITAGMRHLASAVARSQSPTWDSAMAHDALCAALDGRDAKDLVAAFQANPVLSVTLPGEPELHHQAKRWLEVCHAQGDLTRAAAPTVRPVPFSPAPASWHAGARAAPTSVAEPKFALRGASKADIMTFLRQPRFYAMAAGFAVTAIWLTLRPAPGADQIRSATPNVSTFPNERPNAEFVAPAPPPPDVSVPQ